MGPVSDAQKRATAKYIKTKLDEIKIRVSKGQKNLIKEHANKQGESLNKFITRAIYETMERDNLKMQKKREDRPPESST